MEKGVAIFEGVVGECKSEGLIVAKVATGRRRRGLFGPALDTLFKFGKGDVGGEGRREASEVGEKCVHSGR